MRSAARLTYTQVQAAADGRPDDSPGRCDVGSSRRCTPPTRALAAAREKPWRA